MHTAPILIVRLYRAGRQVGEIGHHGYAQQRFGEAVAVERFRCNGCGSPQRGSHNPGCPLSSYASGETPELEDAVRHYVDGDTGSVTAIKLDHLSRTVIRVDWDNDGPNEHFADELFKLDPEEEAERASFRNIEDAADIRGFNDGPLDPDDF